MLIIIGFVISFILFALTGLFAFKLAYKVYTKEPPEVEVNNLFNIVSKLRDIGTETKFEKKEKEVPPIQTNVDFNWAREKVYYE